MNQGQSIRENHSLYFVAIVATGTVADKVMKIKHGFAEKFNSKKPLNSPPHITLINPFYFPDSKTEILSVPLTAFAIHQQNFKILLKGFNAFPPKTIFVDVVPNENLQTLHHNLFDFVNQHMGFISEYITKSFTPHITVGYRDLTKVNFMKAWDIFEHKRFEGEFEVNSLVLLKHNKVYWETFCELPFESVA